MAGSLLPRAQAFIHNHPLIATTRDACHESLRRWTREFWILVSDVHQHGGLRSGWSLSKELQSVNTHFKQRVNEDTFLISCSEFRSPYLERQQGWEKNKTLGVPLPFPVNLYMTHLVPSAAIESLWALLFGAAGIMWLLWNFVSKIIRAWVTQKYGHWWDAVPCPANLRSNLRQGTTIELRWAHVERFTEYTVQQREQLDNRTWDGWRSAGDPEKHNNSFRKEGLQEDTTYEFRVQAIRGCISDVA